MPLSGVRAKFCEVDTSADLINNKTDAAVRRPWFIRVLLPGSFAKMPGEKKDGKGLNDRLWKPINSRC
uniref:Uncharacterized protein n=1 Tax=Oryza meridionalis TaxID=40149 RepID=A0A0E0DR91_9ORYZ